MEDTTAGIPDEAAIASAKLKRQGAVEAEKFGANGEDYISLGNGQIAVHGGDKGPHPESRLMREEDEGDEGDEGGSRSAHKQCRSRHAHPSGTSVTAILKKRWKSVWLTS